VPDKNVNSYKNMETKTKEKNMSKKSVEKKNGFLGKSSALRKVLECLLLVILLAGSVNAATLRVGGGVQPKSVIIVYPTIQAAIDAASSGDTIDITAGTYNGTMNISGKNNLVINGVNGASSTIVQPITLLATGVGHKYDANMHVAVFVNNATNVTIQGLTMSGGGLSPNAVVFWNAATGEIKNSKITDTSTLTGLQTGQGVAVDAGSGRTSILNLTSVDLDKFNKNGVDAIDGNGATSSPGAITLNVNGGNITGVGPTTTIAQNGILFWNRGTGTVGGSVNGVSISDLNYTPTIAESTGVIAMTGVPVSISNSKFTNVETYIYADNSIDASIGNTFDGVAENSATDDQLFAIEDRIDHKLDDPATNGGAGLVTIKPGNVYVTANSGSVQRGVNATSPGDTVNIADGIYTDPVVGSQIVISKNLTIRGMDKTLVIIKPSSDTAASGTLSDADGWFLANPGTTFNLNNVTLDGAGKNISQAIHSHGSGTIQDNIIRNIGYQPSGPAYKGMGIATFDANMVIRRNDLSNIGRIGIYIGSGVTNAIVDHNTYVGKGNGNWLDYGIEIERGGIAVVTNNTVSNNTGVASVDGSNSAGIYATTYFSPGTTATVTGNDLKNNTVGITVGYDSADTATVVAHNNNFTGNGEGVNSTNATVNATDNWWGDNSGPGPVGPGTGDNVSLHVTYDPWIGKIPFNNTWSTWTNLGGLTYVTPDIATFNGKLYASVRGFTTTSLWINSMDIGGVWTGWSPVPSTGFPGALVGAGPSIYQFNNKLYLMATGIDNAIYVTSMDNTGTWAAWTNLGGLTSVTPDIAEFNGRLYASVRGFTSTYLWTNSMDTSGVWAGWTQVPMGSLPGALVGAGPSIYPFNNKLYLMATGVGNAIYVTNMDNTGTWSGWVNLGGLTSVTPDIAAFNGNLYASVRGFTTTSLWTNNMTTGGVWSGWITVPSTGFPGALVGAGPSIYPFNSKLYLMAAGTDDAIYVNNLS